MEQGNAGAKGKKSRMSSICYTVIRKSHMSDERMKNICSKMQFVAQPEIAKASEVLVILTLG